MTSIALQVGLDMLRPFALGLYIVVARRAAAARLGVVEVYRRYPRIWRVATIAAIRGENVVGGLGRGPNRRSYSVAR